MPQRLVDILRVAGIVGVLLLVAFIPLQVGYGTWAEHRALTDEWKIAGPACPGKVHDWRWSPPRTIRYKGVGFSRQYGGIYCEAVPEPGLLSKATYPVCQFSGPARIIVTTADRSTVYEPGIGKRATVTVRKGKVSCVVAGWFE